MVLLRILGISNGNNKDKKKGRKSKQDKPRRAERENEVTEPTCRMKEESFAFVTKPATYRVKPAPRDDPPFCHTLNNLNDFEDGSVKTSRSSSHDYASRSARSGKKSAEKSKFNGLYKVKPVSEVPSEIMRFGHSATAIVKAFMQELNNLTTADSIGKFFTEDAFFVPEDVQKIPMFIFKDILIMIHASLPDMGFDYEKITQQGNTVIVEGSQFSGSHIGAPYSPMPGKLPAIPAAGTYVLVDKERWFLEMEGDKIKTWTLVALGNCTGPMGIYELVGGIVPMSRK